MKPLPLLTLAAAALTLATLPLARANNWYIPSWRERVLTSDLVAEVQCTVAGGNVAKYRLIKVFKGDAKPGAEIVIQQPMSTSFTMGEFPLTLVGERFVVAASRTLPRDNPPTISDFGPLWWRRQHSDFSLRQPDAQTSLDRGQLPGRVSIFQTEFPSLDSFEQQVADLLKQPAAEQEKFLTTWARFTATAPAAQPPKPPTWTPAEFARFETNLTAANGADFIEAFDALLQARPRPLIDFLVARTPRDAFDESGYKLASYFGHLCPAPDRKTLLPQLANAKDPWIRVAAAVYLAFDDLPAATASLKELTKQPGTPGQWAALTLARRGDAASLPQALEILNDPPQATRFSPVRGNLQANLLIFLSNTAAASGVEQPSWTSGKERYERVAAWYKTHRDKLKLTDPWADELAKQRID